MKLPIRLRKLKETDILECIILFQNTIHAVNAKDYSPIQLDAWAPKVKPALYLGSESIDLLILLARTYINFKKK